MNYYKGRYWDYLNNLDISKINIENDKDSIVFTENFEVSIKDYAKKSGSRFLIMPNVFNRKTNIPTRYANRTLDFEIERGFVDKDEFLINIDESLAIEALPNPVSIDNEYGHYSFSVEKIDEKTLKYKRTYLLNKGHYPKEKYKAFREFMADIVKYDKSKIVLITKP